MAHRLKTVHYQNSSRSILLQNENGPCPLLAIANALLLKGVLDLPSKCVRNGAASIEDVVNVLAERATSLSEARRGGGSGERGWTEVTGKTRGKEAKTEAAGGSSPKEGSHARVEEGAGGSSSASKSSPIANVGGAASDALKSGAASPGCADAASPDSAGSDGPSKGSAAPGAVAKASAASSKNGGWIKATDPKTGRAFYANAFTRTTQWDQPSGFVDDDVPTTVSGTTGDKNESPGTAEAAAASKELATEAADGSAQKKAGSAATPEKANDMEAASRANTAQSATTDNAMKGSSDGSPPSFDQHAHHLHELLSLLPSLASGMDVNPTFTRGPTGYEYTANTSTFDMLGVDLVHGWLLDTGECVGNDVERKYREVVGSRSYNEVIECVIKGHEAQEHLERVDGQMEELEKRFAELSIEVDKGVVDGEGHKGESIREGESSSCCQPEKENEADPKSFEEEKKEGVAVARAEQEGGNPSEAAMEASAEFADGDSEETTETARPLPESDKEWVEVEQVNECSEHEVNIATTETEQNVEEGAVPHVHVTEEQNAPTNAAAATPSDIQEEMKDLRQTREDLTMVATNGAILKDFLDSTSHQLTYHGLHELHNFLAEEALVVFFRNNHFATMTKHGGILYLLVTDLGYANVSEVMWEKLDDIDGDTEYYDERFVKPAPRADLSPAAGPTLSPEQLLAQGGQANADYHLAVQLSKEGRRPAGGGGGKSPSGKTASLDEQEGRLMAAATEASLIEWNQRENGYLSQHSSSVVDGPSSKEDVTGAPSAPIEDDDQALARSLQAQMDSDLESERLARRLQEEENRYAAASRRTDAAAGSRSAAAEGNESNKSNCVIS